MHKVAHTFAGQITTDSYADLVGPWDISDLDEVLIVLRNTDGANSADYKVLGSVDGTNFVTEIVAETALAFGASAKVSITEPWLSVKVQIKATVPASQADSIVGDAVGQGR